MKQKITKEKCKCGWEGFRTHTWVDEKTSHFLRCPECKTPIIDRRDDFANSKPANTHRQESPVPNASEKVIRCEVKMTMARRIRCESGGGFFCFEFKNGKKIQKMKITDEAAWMVREMIDSMHPRICGSNNPLWHKVQAMRNNEASNTGHE